MKLWNPAAFFISLIMSMVMAIIFGMFVPSVMGLQGLEPDLCLYVAIEMGNRIPFNQHHYLSDRIRIGGKGISLQSRQGRNGSLESCSIFHKSDDEFHHGGNIRFANGTACGFAIHNVAFKMGDRIPFNQHHRLSDRILACQESVRIWPYGKLKSLK